MPTMARRAEPLKAPKAWLARYPGHASGETRFDVVVVTPGKLPRHIVNAFNAGGKWKRSRHIGYRQLRRRRRIVNCEFELCSKRPLAR